MLEIMGKSAYGMKGKSVQQQPAAVKNKIIELLASVKDHYIMDIILTVDVMRTNKMSILILVS